LVHEDQNGLKKRIRIRERCWLSGSHDLNGDHWSFNVFNAPPFSKNISSVKNKKQFDFVGANLDSKTLLENKDPIVSFMHRKSYLCISGIGRENRKEVHRAYKKLGLRCLKKTIGKDWCGFLYKKRSQRKFLRRKKKINT